MSSSSQSLRYPDQTMTVNYPASSKCPLASARCVEIAKTTGKQCLVDWDLDHESRCETHSHFSEQCKAIAMTTGERCLVKSSTLDAQGHCKRHSGLSPQCRGIAKKTNARCRIKGHDRLDGNGFCKYHDDQVGLSLALARLVLVDPESEASQESRSFVHKTQDKKTAVAANYTD